jgi:hypothetical protein
MNVLVPKLGAVVMMAISLMLARVYGFGVPWPQASSSSYRRRCC